MSVQQNQVIENSISQIENTISNVERDIEKKQREIDSYEYEISESEFDVILDKAEDSVHICGMTFYPSDILKSCDPIAYRCAKSDYESNYDLDDCEDYCDLNDELEELESKLEDLNDELEELNSDLDELNNQDFQDQADNLDM